MSVPESINPDEISPGPIRHDSLRPELLARIRLVYDVLGPYLDLNLEQFEIGFMRDLHPEEEVAVWCSITAAWIAYHKRYIRDEVPSDDEEKKLLAAMLAISTGLDDVASLGVPVEVGKHLRSCYEGLGTK